MDNFLQGVTLSTVNYDSLLSGWNALALQSGNVFSGGNSIYTNCTGAAFTARANLISSDLWTITDGGGVPASCSSIFTFEVKTDNSGSSNNDQFKLPLTNDGTIDLVVDWGDATSDVITAWNDAAVTHTYAAAGTYTVGITATTGTIRGWRFFWSGDPQKVLNISDWGDFDFTRNGAFAGCNNLTCSATDIPTIGTNMSYAFYQTQFNASVTGWDVSAVTNMAGMFTLCSSFNQSGIIGWNTGNVTSFGSMFYGTSFNQDISGWDISSCSNMTQMFSQNTAFNQNIGGWNVSNVVYMGAMFQGATSFNQDISSWNTGNVISMNDMFYNCALFNADISGWNVSKVTNFQNTFNGCTAFDQDLSSWNLGLCTRTIGMFQYATSFNANISGWNVSNVEYFNSMFRGANSFNQNIGGWNTSSGIKMHYMFRDDTVFDQDLSSWDISSVDNLDSFMQGATLSTANYDALLIGWDAQAVVSGLTPNFGSSTYTLGGAAATARANLIASDLWTITDGGGV